MRKHQKADEEYYITAGMILSLCKRADTIFESSEPMEKRQLLNFLLQNSKLQDKKLTFELKTPFNRVLEANNRSDWLPSSNLIITLENQQYMATMRERLENIKGYYKTLNLSPTPATF